MDADAKGQRDSEGQGCHAADCPGFPSDAGRADARRAELRRSCRPAFDGPQPKGIDLLGWIMVTLGALAALASVALLAVSLVDLFRQRELAGETLFAAGVWLVYALFFTRVWHVFRTLPDWRTALDVPLRTKVFCATGSALSASLAGGSLAVLVFAICSKRMFLTLMDAAGAALSAGKVQIIFMSLDAFFFFLLLWYLFQAMMELRDWARTALAMVLTAALVRSSLFVIWALAFGISSFPFSPPLHFPSLTVYCVSIAVLSLAGLVLQLLTTRGSDAARHFRAGEPAVGPAKAGEP